MQYAYTLRRVLRLNYRY